MLINSASYRNGKKVADIQLDDIRDNLNDESFIWVAFQNPTDDEITKVTYKFDLHPLAVEDALNGHQRPKIEEYGEMLFAVIHILEMVDNEVRVGEINIFVEPHYVVSIRSRSEMQLLGVRERCEKEPELLAHGSGFVLYALMDAVVDRYFPIIESLEEELEEIESQIFTAGKAQSNIERLYDLKYKVTIVKHAITPLMEDVGKLYSGRVPTVCANNKEYFRDIYDHLHRMNAVLDGIRETIGTAIQVGVSAISLEQNAVQKRLAAWAGIFAVATAFAGIWGMNFKNMPELEWEWGYPTALLTIVIVCSFLYVRFKRSNWL